MSQENANDNADTNVPVPTTTTTVNVEDMSPRTRREHFIRLFRQTMNRMNPRGSTNNNDTTRNSNVGQSGSMNSNNSSSSSSNSHSRSNSMRSAIKQKMRRKPQITMDTVLPLVQLSSHLHHESLKLNNLICHEIYPCFLNRLSMDLTNEIILYTLTLVPGIYNFKGAMGSGFASQTSCNCKLVLDENASVIGGCFQEIYHDYDDDSDGDDNDNDNGDGSSGDSSDSESSENSDAGARHSFEYEITNGSYDYNDGRIEFTKWYFRANYKYKCWGRIGFVPHSEIDIETVPVYARKMMKKKIRKLKKKAKKAKGKDKDQQRYANYVTTSGNINNTNNNDNDNIDSVHHYYSKYNDFDYDWIEFRGKWQRTNYNRGGLLRLYSSNDKSVTLTQTIKEGNIGLYGSTNWTDGRGNLNDESGTFAYNYLFFANYGAYNETDIKLCLKLKKDGRLSGMLYMYDKETISKLRSQMRTAMFQNLTISKFKSSRATVLDKIYKKQEEYLEYLRNNGNNNSNESLPELKHIMKPKSKVENEKKEKEKEKEKEKKNESETYGGLCKDDDDENKSGMEEIKKHKKRKSRSSSGIIRRQSMWSDSIHESGNFVPSNDDCICKYKIIDGEWHGFGQITIVFENGKECVGFFNNEYYIGEWFIHNAQQMYKTKSQPLITIAKAKATATAKATAKTMTRAITRVITPKSKVTTNMTREKETESRGSKDNDSDNDNNEEKQIYRQRSVISKAEYETRSRKRIAHFELSKIIDPPDEDFDFDDDEDGKESKTDSPNTKGQSLKRHRSRPSYGEQIDDNNLEIKLWQQRDENSSEILDKLDNAYADKDMILVGKILDRLYDTLNLCTEDDFAWVLR